MRGPSSHSAFILAVLAAFLVTSWGRAILSQTGAEQVKKAEIDAKAPRPPEVYTETPWLRDLLLTSPLIPSALPEERRRLSSDEHLRPKSEWSTPRTESQPSDVKIFIGVMTAATAPGTEPDSKYDYTARRNLARTGWMRVAERYRHVAVKFVVGSYSDPGKQASVDEEQRRYGDFMTLTEVDDRYDNLSNKTRYFFRDVYRMYPNVDFIVKIDDDVLILPDRLLMIADQWTSMRTDYIGCANKVEPQTQPSDRWYDPHHRLVGKVYPLYFHGSIYALSGRIVRDVILPNFDDLRTCLEDIAMSWWMLASDAVFFEDRRLCRLTCDDATVALADQEQQGFPMKYWSKVLSNEGCTRTPKFPLPYVPVQFKKYPGLEKMHELMI